MVPRQSLTSGKNLGKLELGKANAMCVNSRRPIRVPPLQCMPTSHKQARGAHEHVCHSAALSESLDACASTSRCCVAREACLPGHQGAPLLLVSASRVRCISCPYLFMVLRGTRASMRRVSSPRLFSVSTPRLLTVGASMRHVQTWNRTLSKACFHQKLHCYKSYDARQWESARISRLLGCSSTYFAAGIGHKLLQTGFIATSCLYLYSLGQRGDKKNY